eukprot:53833-Amphidinium_carterae.1
MLRGGLLGILRGSGHRSSQAGSSCGNIGGPHQATCHISMLPLDFKQCCSLHDCFQVEGCFS